MFTDARGERRYRALMPYDEPCLGTTSKAGWNIDEAYPEIGLWQKPEPQNKEFMYPCKTTDKRNAHRCSGVAPDARDKLEATCSLPLKDERSRFATRAIDNMALRVYNKVVFH